MFDELKNELLAIRAELERLYEAEPTEEEIELAEENGEAYDLRSYFSDPLSYTYSVSSDGDYISVKVYLAFGGPNIWIDTSDCLIIGAWGLDRCEICLPDNIRDEIDDIFSEQFGCLLAKR